MINCLENGSDDGTHYACLSEILRRVFFSFKFSNQSKLCFTLSTREEN